ncbi:MAG: hypothetical protein D3909_11070, partial [Candidatus Electrothrix sp. ATG1]|nr:hypothetical protein [Candidatus Electrothrix sp. ATG1]
SLVREQGPAAVQGLVETADPLAEFVFSALQEEHGLTLSGKNRIIAELAEMVEQAADADQRELMAAHFSEQLGISPDRFLAKQKDVNQVVPVPVPVPDQEWCPEPGAEMLSGEEWQLLDVVPPDLEEGWVGSPPTDSRAESEKGASLLYGLPKKQRQLLDFLLLHPEFLPKLLAGGLKESLGQSPIMGFVDAMEQLAAAGPCAPEHLLSVVTTPFEKQYLADLLIKGGGELFHDETEEQSRVMCDELLIWLKKMQHQREGTELQKQIFAAEQVGEYSLVSKLQRKKILALEEKNS